MIDADADAQIQGHFAERLQKGWWGIYKSVRLNAETGDCKN